MASIPASQIVNVLPSVLGAAGAALSLNGLLISQQNRIPIGTVISFPSQVSVAAYFGSTSVEAQLATNYFLGFTGAQLTPGALLMASYYSSTNTSGTQVPAYVRGGSLASLSLAALQALSGTLTVTQNGTAITSSNIVLTGVASFSAAAAIMQAAFPAGDFLVSFDSISNAFNFLDDTGPQATGTLSFFTANALSSALNLTQATGAVVSPGGFPGAAASFMPTITAITQNWASFTTTFEPAIADKVAFGLWTGQQNNRYLYAMWDTNAAPTVLPDTTSAGYQIIQAGSSGVSPIYQSPNDAAALMGQIASLNFNQTNGRFTSAFRMQSGLPATVTNALIASNLELNGYNFRGNYATANASFTFYYPGSITGPFEWVDPYVCQIHLNADLQLSLLGLVTSAPLIPYNAAGYALIEAACYGPIQSAVNFGTIQPGVTLTPLQAQEINNAAGRQISQTLSTTGWYLLIADPGPNARQARTSPNCTLWYQDGGSVQQIIIQSIDVQ